LDHFLSIVFGIVSAYIYDKLKEAYENTEKETTTEEYDENYIISVKKEFYISFILGIVFNLIPNVKYDFFNILFNTLTYFSFFISLMGFMCLVDVVNYLTNKNTNN